MLDITNSEWPDEFPMQEFIDYRSAQGERDNLPTTEELEEERSGREASDEESDDEESDDEPSEDAEAKNVELVEGESEEDDSSDENE